MYCENCKHWQGNKNSEWADCYMGYHQIASLNNYKDRFTTPCIAPFDPHDLRYYLSTSPIHKEFERLCIVGQVNENVRVITKKEKVLWMDDHGLETERVMDIPYFQTTKHGECEEYDARH